MIDTKYIRKKYLFFKLEMMWDRLLLLKKSTLFQNFQKLEVEKLCEDY